MQYVCAELITQTARLVLPQDEYRLEFYCGEIPLPISAGSYRYETVCRIMPRLILAATGRNEVFTDCPKEHEPRQAIPVSVHEEDLPGLNVRLKNNRIFDVAEIIRSFSLRLRQDGRILLLPLSRRDVKAFPEGHGAFIIPLGEHLL